MKNQAQPAGESGARSFKKDSRTAGASGARDKVSPNTGRAGKSRTAGASGARATGKNVSLDNRSNTAGPGPALHNGRELPERTPSKSLTDTVPDLSPRGSKK